MIRVGILGAKGYASGEAMRWLAGHPEVELACLMGRVDAPEPVENYFGDLRGRVTRAIEPMDLDSLPERCDAIFMGLPHTVAQEYAATLARPGVKLFDLSADFRFDSIETYEATYGLTHAAAELNDRFIYALPELFGDKFAQAEAFALPGCYPTAILLALAPLLAHGDRLDLDRVIVNAATGVSGAGRKLDTDFLFAECNEAVRAYAVGTHRHRPEIEEKLAVLTSREMRITFTPHLVPMTRGILATSTISCGEGFTTQQAHDLLCEFYSDRPFVRVLPPGQTPSTADVNRTNYCDIGAVVDEHTGMLIVVSAIDNLAKGTASQGVQAMNIAYGLPETLGLAPDAASKSHV